MFDITPQDIAQLDDKKLRTLVALLCEAELRGRGYSTASITWGGDQNAKDGGLDVRVSLPNDKPIDGFIPRGSTGFQVKKQDMPPRAVAGEMCPKGALRPVIRELAECGGAYIIVSSEGSTSDIALTNRIAAMANASKEVADQLFLDFYDRTRLATWVRNHAGLVVWVRREIGRAISGWQPYDAWAYPAGGVDAEYLFEKGVRVHDRAARNDHDLPAVEGLKKIRAILRSATGVVRLVGLSGVGKTRFAQALFDQRIDGETLDPALVVYTNMNDDPNPQPLGLASDLIANCTAAILIVDNCAPDLHARLAALVKAKTSLVSVLTVEYDIQDDLPEGTEAFELRAASIELIEKLLRIRFPNLSQIDTKTAADFSGGNARIAIALAETIKRGGTLAKLNDTQLFERLFVQRQGPDRSLFETAQACAMVYSFNGEDISDDKEAELVRISGLIGVTAENTYRAVAELLRRELAQKRGKWRAILPHAVANRLATIALQNIPFSRIQELLINGAPERLTLSLSRRLGYLDSSKEAINIVVEWLGPKGWIGEHVWNLNEFGKAIFRNSLPAAPEAGLRALEANLPPYDAETPITTGEYVPRALRSLAWDAAFFDRCARLLEILAIYGEASAKEATEIHASLFHLYLSGTHATIEQRAAAARRLLCSGDGNERGLGTAALSAMLKCNHFSSDYNFEFGARSRDYGYQPRTYGDVTHWYRTAFAVAKEFALAGDTAAKAAISRNFRGMWTQVGLRDELEAIAAEFATRGFWRDGWLAVKYTRFYDEKNRTSENYMRLSMLEEMLRPKDLIQRVQGQVFSSKSFYDVDDIESDDNNNFHVALEKRQKEVKELGSEVAADEEALRELMPEIVGGEGQLWYFGMGLAQGTNDPNTLWQQMVKQFEATPIERRDTRALCGFLLELSTNKSPLPDAFLDAALDNEPLAPYFPSLQASVPITPRGMARLNRSIELGKAPIHIYSNIQLGRAVEVVPAADIATYITSLTKKPEGEPVAINLLSFQFFSDRQNGGVTAPEIVEAGRAILRNLDFDRHTKRDDYHLQGVVEVCASGDGGYEVAKRLIENLKQAVEEHRTYGADHNHVLKALFKAQPKAALDALLSDKKKLVTAGNLINRSAHLQGNPIDEVSEEILFAWCAEDPTARFPAVAAVVSAFALTADQNTTGWTTIAPRLVQSAPDPLAVFQVFVERLRPMSWSGSRSSLLQANAKLLDQFDVQGNIGLATYIAVQKAALEKEAGDSLDWDDRLDRERDERFE
jgi:hypothetical protein